MLLDPAVLETPYRKSNHGSFCQSNRRVLGITGVVAITYFFGCGGPLGSEPIISSSGPIIGLPAMVLYPLLVTVPYAYIVAELCSAFPEDGGFTVWVHNAFGKFWGFQVGYWSWISGVFNTALLPGFMLEILQDHYGVSIGPGAAEYFVKVILAMALSMPSVIGTRTVARTCIVLLVLVLVPVVVFAAWAYSRSRDWGDLLEVRHERNVINTELGNDEQVGNVKINWALLLNTLFWAFDGINMASVFGGEVANPARVFSRAIGLTVLLTLATYIVPMPGAILVDDPNWTYFTRDSYPALASAIGGPFLKAVFVASSVFSIAGLFISGIFCKAIQVAGMAEGELVPSLFAVRNLRFDSPHVAIFVTTGATIALLGVDFDNLLPMANAFAGAVQLLIILAVIHLRKTLPYIPRPTKVPGGVRTLCVVAVLPAVALCYIIFDAFSSLVSAVIIFAFVLPGLGYGAYEKRHSATFSPREASWR